MLSFDLLDQARAEIPPGWQPPRDSMLALRQALVYAEEHHPLSRRYQAQQGNWKVTKPWQVIGEQIFIAGRIADPECVELDGKDSDPDADFLRNGIAAKIITAQPYLWSAAADRLARSAPLPPHVISKNLLPYPLMYFSREDSATLEKVRVDGAVVAPEQVKTHWILFMHAPHGIEVTFDLTGSGKPRVSGLSIAYGSKYPDDFPYPMVRATVEQWLQMLAFISSPYVETPKQRLDRPTRRELQRYDSKAPEPEVYTVVLRRAAQERQTAHDALTAAEMKHHWWVSGHYRAQWYPSTKSHQVIWIAPYIKGDLDKPLLEKVYVVTR